MSSITFSEARAHLSVVLDQVARGMTVLITRHGKPAALLSPPPAQFAKEVGQVITDFKAFSKRQERSLKGLSIRAMVSDRRTRSR